MLRNAVIALVWGTGPLISRKTPLYQLLLDIVTGFDWPRCASAVREGHGEPGLCALLYFLIITLRKARTLGPKADFLYNLHTSLNQL